MAGADFPISGSAPTVGRTNRALKLGYMGDADPKTQQLAKELERWGNSLPVPFPTAGDAPHARVGDWSGLNHDAWNTLSISDFAPSPTGYYRAFAQVFVYGEYSGGLLSLRPEDPGDTYGDVSELSSDSGFATTVGPALIPTNDEFDAPVIELEINPTGGSGSLGASYILYLEPVTVEI